MRRAMAEVEVDMHAGRSGDGEVQETRNETAVSVR